MPIKLHPDATRDNVVQALTDVQNRIESIRGGGISSHRDTLGDYLDWTAYAAGRLRNQITASEIHRLIRSGHYEHLRTAGRPDGPTRNLLSLEIDERIDALRKEFAELQRLIGLWPAGDRYVSFDTSLCIRHPDKFADVDFHDLLGLDGHPVHLLIPILVVDELDGLKESKDNHTRWRAGHAVGRLDEIFTQFDKPSIVKHGLGGKVTLTANLLFDPPAHVRLPIDDDELVDRLATIQPVTGSKVQLITYDTGQGMRARRAGLDVLKLKRPPEPEPDPAAAPAPKSRRAPGGS